MKVMQENENNTVIDEVLEAPTQVYEVGYLLAPTVAETEVPAMYGNIKELVSTLEGVTISDDMPKYISLAYPMTKVVSNVRSKFDSAYFGWVKFTMPKSKVLELKKKLDLDTNIIRFLILKTIKENTIASKRFIGRDSTHKRTPSTKKEDAEATPINKEEVDREIDAMVAA